MPKEKKQGTEQGKAQYMPAPGMPCPELKLAQVYIPVQRLGETYPPSRALQAGTLFPELCRPYKY